LKIPKVASEWPNENEMNRQSSTKP
jgi:hypothetical protein